MFHIVLSERQSSMASQASAPVEVRDLAGRVLGRLVAEDSMPTDWVDRWLAWHLVDSEDDPPCHYQFAW